MGKGPGYTPYEPQLRPIPWGQNIWTVDGPEVTYSSAGVSVPCPTRMTIIRLNNGTLWLHSPVISTQELVSACAALGPVSALIAPNALHCSFIGDWARIFPEASLFAAPGTHAPGVEREVVTLGPHCHPDWRDEIDVHLFSLGHFCEAVFFHRQSRTLVVTDMMQNFETGRVRSLFTRIVLRAAGALGPIGSPSAEIRRTARSHRKALVQGVETMLAWNPETIILAHGACYRGEAIREIKRAFDWLLPAHS